MRRHAVGFSDIASRLTGISTPVFGVSWNPPENKRDVVRRLVIYLEDRRALYADYDVEVECQVAQSVLAMRHELTDILMNCPDGEDLSGPIRAMRAACRKFLDVSGRSGLRGRHYRDQEMLTWSSLGELRGVFGLHLARLCAAYGVDVEEELATIFPGCDTQAEEDDEA